MQTIEQVMGGKKKTDLQRIIEAYVVNRGLTPSNPYQWKWVFAKQSRGAKALLGMSGGDVDKALKALAEISVWLDKKVEDGWEEWTNINAVVNQYMAWEKQDGV